jgi:hypothetical protein
MIPLTDRELESLETLAASATPAPWFYFGSGIVSLMEDDSMTPDAAFAKLYYDGEGNNHHNRAFPYNANNDGELIATMRNALPSLLAEVRELRAAVETETRINVAQLNELRELREFKARCFFGEPKGGE